MTALQFPAAPARAWRILESDLVPDEYVGQLVPADDWPGPTCTESGPLGLVVEAVLQRHVRRGLPIVAPLEALAMAAKLTRGHPSSLPRVRTDREKFEAALLAQKLAGDSRWVPCNPWGGSAA